MARRRGIEFMSFAGDLASLFGRDLSKLVEQVRAFPSDEALWETPPGVINSAGTLTLHIDGNLREYIGRHLGGVGYTRDRPTEFSARGVSRDQLIARISELRALIPSILASLSEAHSRQLIRKWCSMLRCRLGGFCCTYTGTSIGTAVSSTTYGEFWRIRRARPRLRDRRAARTSCQCRSLH
jgi:hypothetical protein